MDSQWWRCAEAAGPAGRISRMKKPEQAQSTREASITNRAAPAQGDDLQDRTAL
jgi:hypothetical protein